jgi:thiol-disulfide isomerase/thioredoxin
MTSNTKKTAIPVLSNKAMNKYMATRPMLVAGTAGFCGHCHKLYPELVKLSKMTDKTVATYAAYKHSQDMGELGLKEVGMPIKEVIKGFPTILLFNGKGGAAVYQGAREAGEMKTALDHFTNQK